MEELRPRQIAAMHRHEEMALSAYGNVTPLRGRPRPEAEARGPSDVAAPVARPRGDLVKAGIDRSAALLALVLLLPMLLMVAALIWLRDPGPVLFAHPRVGQGGRMFRCLKFRTMVRNGDEVLARHLERSPEAAREWEETRKLRDDPRVTRLGRTLRKTSIDELPQLINVLKGEMSLVGPRPIVEAEARHYGAVMREYTAVRPGLTGLWQVGGRSDTTYAERVRLDQTYVRTQSLALDLKIILRTVVVVLKGRGSY
jgi:exopolysaccharide production protein ExoY